MLLLALSGAFSGSEAVLFSLTSSHLEQAGTSTSRMQRLVPVLMRRPKRTLTTILVGNTAVNVLFFANTYVLFENLAHLYGAWITPLAGVATVLLVVLFGEVVPKIIGVNLAQRLAPWSAAFVHFSGYVLEPIGRAVDWVLVKPIERLVFGHTGQSASGPRHPLSTAELKALLELSRRRRTINRVEDEFLRSVIGLGALRVRDLMTPRVEIVAFDVNGDAAALRTLMRSRRLKKIPVYDGEIDNIVGLIYAKLLFLSPPDVALPALALPVRFVPEQAQVEHLLHHFRTTRTQLAIVVDEYGGLAGLVTLEDILEEIVGELNSNSDAQGPPEVVAIGQDEYEISGQLGVHYWAELFNLPPARTQVATVGGLVTAELGRPARVDDEVEFSNLRLRVLSTVGNRIGRLRVSLRSDGAAAATDGASA